MYADSHVYVIVYGVIYPKAGHYFTQYINSH